MATIVSSRSLKIDYGVVAFLLVAAMGWLHDLTRQWTAPLACLVVVALLQAIVGYGAGRNRHV